MYGTEIFQTVVANKCYTEALICLLPHFHEELNQTMAKPLNPLETEIAISALHSTGDFVVLRRLDLERDPRFSRRPAVGSLVALCLDTETTGMDHGQDKARGYRWNDGTRGGAKAWWKDVAEEAERDELTFLRE